MSHDKSPKSAAANTGPALDAVSRRLRQYYDSVKDEAIPEQFLDLLERLDEADRAQGAQAGPKPPPRSDA